MVLRLPAGHGHLGLHFLAVMLVVVEDEALRHCHLAAEGVDAVLLAAAVVLGALPSLSAGEQAREDPGLCKGQGHWHPKGSGGLAGASSPPWGRQGRERRSRRWWGSRALPHAEPAGGPSCAERKLKWTEEGWGLELTSRHLYHYLLTGQTDKWKKQTHGQADCKRKEQGAGVPLLLHNRKCHRHHQNGRGRGQEGPLSMAEGGGGESTSSVPARGRWAGRRRRVGVGGCKAPAHIPSKVRFLSNKESGRPGWPHWGAPGSFSALEFELVGGVPGGCRASRLFF